jgi:hypothetical protein
MAGTPRVTYDPMARRWELTEAWTPPFRDLPVVPAGFRSDLSSIPRVLWPFVGPHELGLSSGVMHDFLYRSSGYSRAFADEAFRRLMEWEGIPQSRRTVAYIAVRIFGGRAYRA